jgi:hypothetical protein
MKRLARMVLSLKMKQLLMKVVEKQKEIISLLQLIKENFNNSNPELRTTTIKDPNIGMSNLIIPMNRHF